MNKPLSQIRIGASTLTTYAIDLATITGCHDDEGFKLAIVTFDNPPECYDAHARLFAPHSMPQLREWIAQFEPTEKGEQLVYGPASERLVQWSAKHPEPEEACMTNGCKHAARWRVRWSDIKKSLNLCDEHKEFALSLVEGSKFLQIAPLPSCAN